MKKIILGGLAAIALVPMIASCDRTVKPVREIPVEDFFRNPDVSGYTISPHGDYYAFQAPYQDRQNIFVQEIGGGEPVRITSETERDIAGYFWANNDRIVFLKDTGGDENFQLHGVRRDGSEPIAYTAIPGVRTGIIDPLYDIDSLMIIQTNQRDPMVFDPYRLNLDTGEMTMLAVNPGYIQGWQTDHDGRLRVAYAIMDGVNTQVLYRESEDMEFRPVVTTNFKEELYFAEFTPDNKNVYAITNVGRDKNALVLMDPATCEELEMLYTNDKYDISGLMYSRHRNLLEGVVYNGHKRSGVHFFDDEAETVYNRLKARVGEDQYFAIVSSTMDESRCIVYVGGDRTLGSYHIYDVDTDQMTKIGDLAPWIDPDEMASMLPVTYTARDGLEIEAYLTLPAGYTMDNARNLPLVLNPHGGPWVRDRWGFNPEVQFLANRGYAVLQPNYRGSTGFGRNFTEISYKQWGQSMQDDLTDGVYWLIEEGIADPERIAIYGGSYGGYAALQGIVKDPDLYACAIDYVGVSNLFTFLETIPPYWKPMLDMMYEMVGDPVADSLMLAQNSPALNADRITAPLFVVQGANDPRVNKAESDQMVEALRARGVEVDYMVKYDEGHGFHNQENQFEFYAAMEKFLAEHMNGE